jgi:starvation-inducible outer membrane lipoprotein
MIRLLTAISLTACLTAPGAVAQSNKQTWSDLLKPYDAKTKPSVPVAQPEPAQSTTLAQVTDTAAARIIVLIALYDSKCETLPKAVMSLAERSSGHVSMQAMKTQTADLLAQYKKDGALVWCAETKQAIQLVTKEIY